MISGPREHAGGKAGLIRRTLKHPLSRIALELVIFLGILFILKSVVIKPGLGLLGLDESSFRAWQGLITIAALFGVYVLIIRLYERRRIQELALARFVPEAIFGIAGGAVLVSIIFAILYSLGVYRIVDHGLVTAMIVPAIWVILFAALEELMFRGVLYRNLEQWLGTLAALLISAAIFGIMHIFNDDADITIVVSASAGGLLLGALYSLTGRLWIPIFFHASWNFTQAIYGSEVSGAGLFGSYFESVLEGPDWLTGGAFGIENSVLTIGLLFVVITLLMLHLNRRDLFIKSRRSG